MLYQFKWQNIVNIAGTFIRKDQMQPWIVIRSKTFQITSDPCHITYPFSLCWYCLPAVCPSTVLYCQLAFNVLMYCGEDSFNNVENKAHN